MVAVAICARIVLATMGDAATALYQQGARHLANAQDARSSGETFMLVALAVALLGGTSLAVTEDEVGRWPPR